MSLIQRVNSDVRLAQQGDMQAYSRLIQHCQNVVTSIALAIVKDIDDSEEVAQQVFISAWENLKKLKNSDSFLPWIRQSTRYTAFNFLRDNKSSARMSSEQADIILAQVADPSLANDDRLMIENQNVVLQHFIDQLAEDEREIVLLYYREEQSSKQVAELLSLSESNVRKKLSRVRQNLKSESLKRVTHLVYSTAPAIGFSALMSSLIVPSAPVAAAAVASSVGSKASSSLIGKVATVLGGAFLGAFLAIIAVMWSTNMAMKNVPAEDKRRLLKRYRNEMIAWIVVFGSFFSASYQFTAGWIVPILSYFIFMLGFVVLMLRQMGLLNNHSVLVKNGESKRPSLKNRIFSYVCLAMGMCISLAATVVGLINSGRLVW
jgi:RNA polymerase sigma factor (sigma-70 family)